MEKDKSFLQYHSVRSRKDDLLGAVKSELFDVTKPLFSQSNCRKTSPYKLPLGLAIAWLNGPVVNALGCYSVLPGSKPTT